MQTKHRWANTDKDKLIWSETAEKSAFHENAAVYIRKKCRHKNIIPD